MFSLLKKSRTPSKPKAPLQRMHDVAGRSLPLVIQENLRATRITLRIEPGGKGLKLTIPYGLHHREVDDFLDRHHGWLKNRLEKLGPEQHLRHGGTISIRGICHRIEHTGTLRGVTQVLHNPEGEAILRVSGLPEHTGRRISAYLKKEARADLERLVAMHAKTVGRPVRSLTMKDTRSRWGSCSYEGNLSFSWRIVMAPDSVIDYLAAHEVAHLREMNHGPKFWALCKALCPHMEESKAWLKRHGSQLHALDFS